MGSRSMGERGVGTAERGGGGGMMPSEGGSKLQTAI